MKEEPIFFKNCRNKNYICHKYGERGHLAPQCSLNRANFLYEETVDSDSEGDNQIFNFRDNQVNETYPNDNVKPFYINLVVENIPMHFEIDSGFAHSTISEKLYLKHFQNKV